MLARDSCVTAALKASVWGALWCQACLSLNLLFDKSVEWLPSEICVGDCRPLNLSLKLCGHETDSKFFIDCTYAWPYVDCFWLGYRRDTILNALIPSWRLLNAVVLLQIISCWRQHVCSNQKLMMRFFAASVMLPYQLLFGVISRKGRVQGLMLSFVHFRSLSTTRHHTKVRRQIAAWTILKLIGLVQQFIK